MSYSEKFSHIVAHLEPSEYVTVTLPYSELSYLES